MPSMWATRALAVWRGTQTQATKHASTLGVGSRCRIAPLTISRYASTAAASEAESESTSSPSEASTQAELNSDAVPFASLAGKVHPSTLQALTKGPFNYVTMSPVQSRILPLLPGLVAPRGSESTDSSLDLLVKARTGTGKTIGFLVPAIEARIRELASIASKPSSMPTSTGTAPHQRSDSRGETMFAKGTVGTLILSPTRELASQIAIESQKLTSHLPGFTTHLFVGGVDKQRQMRDFQHGRKDVLVATPGRMRDMIQDSRSGVANALKGCKMLILDEADTLLDMGFRDDIEDITRHLTASADGRQTFLFSATVSPAIQAIARTTLHPTKHTFVNCVAADSSEVHDHIPQYHTSISNPSEQLPHIARLLIQDQLEHGEKSKVVLFLPTTKQTILFAQIINDLGRHGGVLPQRRNDVFELHSKRTMTARTKAAEQFRRSTRPSILVTSDVSARGVDYPGVTRVIQVGLPKSAEQYVHRVGRTGRGSSKVGRGDIVLLDWEREFVRRNFSHLPLKPLSVADLSSEVSSQVIKSENKQFQALYDELDRTLVEFVPRIDGEMVSESVASLAGFYAGLASSMGMSIDGIVEGLKKWSMEGMGLTRPPYISAAFLAKIGGGKGDRGSSFNRERRNSSFDSERRGSEKVFGRERSSSFGGGFGGDRQGMRRSSERTANSFGQKREWRDDGERKPYTPRRSFDTEDGERRPFQRRNFGGEDGERKPFVRRSFGEDGERRPFQRREFGEDGERRPFVKRTFGEDGERKPFQRRSFGEDGERKPFTPRKKDTDLLFDF